MNKYKEAYELLKLIIDNSKITLKLNERNRDLLFDCINVFKEAADKANKYDNLKQILDEYNVTDNNIREILLGGNQAKELLDKATSKKPITKVAKGSYDPVYFHYCPVCNFFSVEKDYANFCPNCSQKLDWSEDNKN